MAGSHDLSFVAVRGASGSRQIYRLVIFARYHVRFRSRAVQILDGINLLRLAITPFRSNPLYPDASLRQNKFLSNGQVVYSFLSPPNFMNRAQKQPVYLDASFIANIN